ncbi:hypothetical protein BCV71DRAFT_185659 [Rhizopus microsporus]|uniref:N-acetyltransferase domain-containing protein n=1 Tax=Rhizopus microsporus TaxID=58291 RepID=A0A1X0RTG6_RHIZD|nr:hypothetical protein BCV71DRAFT_185659 [Rhizopus microsporus]
MTQTPTSSLISKHYKLSTNNKVSPTPLLPLSSNSTISNNSSNSSNSSSSSSSNSSHSNSSHTALCYLPTRCPNIIEFYHIEIPFTYRHQGLGDLILQKAFQWAEKAKKVVIPTCPFVRKYLENRLEKCIVNQEQKTLSTSSSSIVEKEL